MYYRFGDDNGIDVSLINPPPTKTHFHKTSGFKGDTTKFWKVHETAQAILDNIFYDDKYIKLWMYNVGVFYIDFYSCFYQFYQGFLSIYLVLFSELSSMKNEVQVM